jgi:hypothetical protein
MSNGGNRHASRSSSRVQGTNIIIKTAKDVDVVRQCEPFLCNATKSCLNRWMQKAFKRSLRSCINCEATTFKMYPTTSTPRKYLNFELAHNLTPEICLSVDHYLFYITMHSHEIR